MKKSILCILLTVMISSCNFLGSVDSSIQTKNIEYNESDIIGTWKLDKFSYDYLTTKENLDSIYVIFKADSTFVLNNSIKLFEKTANLSNDERINGKLDNIKSVGKWWINSNANQTNLILNFNDGINISKINVYKKANELQLWYHFNDPDSGQRLRFINQE
jgi:hypothetical protein